MPVHQSGFAGMQAAKYSSMHGFWPAYSAQRWWIACMWRLAFRV